MWTILPVRRERGIELRAVIGEKSWILSIHSVGRVGITWGISPHTSPRRIR
jgi:hypothetical protein